MLSPEETSMAATSAKDASVLSMCVENAGRPQMAEVFAHRCGLDASSAGTLPSTEVIPAVVQLMLEKGINVSRSVPRMLTSQMISEASLVVTMGCSVEEACPLPMLAKMQTKLLDWDLRNPKGKPATRERKQNPAKSFLLRPRWLPFSWRALSTPPPSRGAPRPSPPALTGRA